MNKIVVISTEVSSGSDDEHTSSAYLFNTLEDARSHLTEWGYKKEEMFHQQEYWHRYGGFHNEQRAQVFTIKKCYK